MPKLLRIDASARSSRSLSRALGNRFISEWLRRNPGDEVILRDIGKTPPPAISEAWIAAAFTPPERRSLDQAKALAVSDDLIAELRRADLIVVTTPMYNYGMPSALKAWVDQVVRVNETFTFDLGRGDHPLEPVFTGKTMVMLTASGEFGFSAGGIRQDMDHLVPHLNTVSKYLGVTDSHHIGIEYQEFDDLRHARSVADAHDAIPALVDRLTAADANSSRPVTARAADRTNTAGHDERLGAYSES